MSEYFLAKYRPIVDALLNAHGLSVPEMARDMLADTITHERELPQNEPRESGSRSALPALRTARTHAVKLIEYAVHPPTRKASVPLRCAKLAAAIRGSDIAVLTLGIGGINPNSLLDSLDAGNVTTAPLRRLVRVVAKIEKQHEDERKNGHGIGRPWAAHTPIVRGGCIAWKRAGRRVTYSWNAKSTKQNRGKLTGKLPAFLRDLIACCDGMHELVKEAPRRVPVGYRDPRPVPRGNSLRKRIPDYVLRDAIDAWRKRSALFPAKT